MARKKKGNPAGRAKTHAVQSNTVFFYLPNERPYGIFCQWQASTIEVPTRSLHFLESAPATSILAKHEPNITFSCAEQFYMWCKAVYFSDASSCARILASTDPKDQKKLGQKVKNFNDYKWNRVKSRVARVGNWYKFRQNAGMRETLLGTGERELCEASRVDRVWGIGFKASEAEDHRSEWGESLLGKALMAVRGRLQARLEAEAEGATVEWEWDGEEDVEADGE